MLEKMLGKRLLEQFEKLEAEESKEVKEMAEMARVTPKPKARGTVAKTPPAKLPKILDPEQWRWETLKGQLQVR